MKVSVGNDLKKSMKRNVLIHTRKLTIPGGKQTYLLAIQDYFENEVSYFYYGARLPVKESKFKFVKRFIGDYIKFYRLLKKGNYDIVHINTSLNLKSYFRDSVFTLISKSLKYSTVVYWHGWNLDFEKQYADKIHRYFHFTFGKADSMICLAKEFADKIKEYKYTKPVYVETTVVEDKIFDYGLTAPAINAVENSEKNILFLSRVEKEKGIYETIDCFEKLKLRFPKLTLTIAGTGNELENAIKYVAQKGLEAVQFLGWIEGNKKIETLYNTDLLVLASYSEGMPICVLEAMASGKSVVTTNFGAIIDFFEDGKMGLKVKSKDSIDLEQKIERLLSNPKLMNQIGKYNAAYAKERFKPELVCRRLENIYEKTISASKKCIKSG